MKNLKKNWKTQQLAEALVFFSPVKTTARIKVGPEENFQQGQEHQRGFRETKFGGQTRHFLEGNVFENPQNWQKP